MSNPEPADPPAHALAEGEGEDESAEFFPRGAVFFLFLLLGLFILIWTSVFALMVERAHPNPDPAPAAKLK